LSHIHSSRLEEALIDWNVDKLMDKIVQDFVRLVKFYKKERELIITTNRPLTPQELEHYKQTFKVTYFTPDSFVTIVNQVLDFVFVVIIISEKKK
jgi:F0F1-type ATP synthase delta subunit